MNIGGWHVFAGLFFLVCCIVLTLGYVYAVYVFVVAIKKVRYKLELYKVEHMRPPSIGFWNKRLGESWNDSGLIKEIKSKHINVAVLRQGTTINILKDLALVLVSKGGFSCDHPLIERLYSEYLTAMSDDPEKNYFLKYSKISRRKASVEFQSSVYSPAGGAANYLLSYICKKEMPVEKYKVVSRLDTYCEFDRVVDVEFLFEEELKPLLKSKKDD